MRIRLNLQNLVNDISARWLMELQDKHPQPPRGIMLQSINEADARLRTVLARYMVYVAEIGEFDFSDEIRKEDSLVYDLELTKRKEANKTQALTDLVHSFMVNSALTKILASVNADLSAKHENQAASDMQSLLSLLHSKLPPLQ